MVNIYRMILPFLSSSTPLSQTPLQGQQHSSLKDDVSATVPVKSIAIVGAGSAGLAVLKTLLDIEPQLRKGWEIVLFEERDDVGGIWLPDNHDVHPPDLPETPLYPLLHTNTPVPSMAYPGYPFPAGTPLYPSHEYVEAYHLSYAKNFDLLPYIHFKHKIQQAAWDGTPEKGKWNLTISTTTFSNCNSEKTRVREERKERVFEKTFNHLIVATGNNHIPNIPIWEGQDEWLKNTPKGQVKRRIVHSVYYREPGEFAGQNVLIVGNGGSGRDAAIQVGPLAKTAWLSIRHPDYRHPGDIIEGVITKPQITHFTPSSVVFEDNSTISPDTVILGTGYQMIKPFLLPTNELIENTTARSPPVSPSTLTTNHRYIFPLYRHILSLSDRYPTNALAFIGLPSYIANCPSNIAQSRFVAGVILHDGILPERKQLLRELREYEEDVRKAGLDPYSNGHRMLNGTNSSDYQDELVEFLKEKKAIPPSQEPYVEPWRRDIFNYEYLRRGWARIEKLGTGKEWTKDAVTEAQWVDVMKKVNKWQGDWEKEHGNQDRNYEGWAG